MKTIRFTFVALLMGIGASLHCGSSPGTPDGPHLSTGGTGGGGGLGGYDSGATPDAPMDSETLPSLVLDGGLDGSGTSDQEPPIDCAGLTPAQCHDRIINPLTIPATIQVQDPGPNAPIPYPNCAAI